MNHKESNGLNPEFVRELDQALDEINGNSDIKSLVITGEVEKYFCTGMDLEWANQNMHNISDLLFMMTSLFNKILLFPLPTIACINGHAYGGGAVLSFLLDYRFMRQDKGFIKIPAVNLDIAFPFSMMKIVEKVVSPTIARDMILTGRRFNAQEALKEKLVDNIFEKEELLPKSIEFARDLGKLSNKTYSYLKMTMYRSLSNIIQNENWQGFSD